MTQRIRTRTWIAAAFVLATAPLLWAQALEAPRAPNLPDEGGYGGDLFVTFIGASEFQPSSSSAIATGYLITDGTRWPNTGNAGNAVLVASFNGRIPEGAIIDEMCVYGLDTTNTIGENLYVNLARNRLDSATGLNASVAYAGTVSSFGSPGSFVECVPVSARVRSRWDIDSDGTTEMVDHNIVAEFGENRDIIGGAIRIRGVRLRWRRDVSPAPGTATFGDVPTNHGFFPFVEALVASGITAGCGGGNYCVDQPLTRGEMAVFLAVALGLHWPAF